MKKIFILLFTLFIVNAINAQTAPYATTTTLNLGLWHQGDTAGYAAINGQWWKIDSAITKDRDSIAAHYARLNLMPTLAANNVFSGTNTFTKIQTSNGSGQRVVIDNTNMIKLFDASNAETDIYGLNGTAYVAGPFVANLGLAAGPSSQFLVGFNGDIEKVNNVSASSSTNKVLRSNGSSFIPDIDPYVYNLYNSYTQAGSLVGNSAALPTVWQAAASTAPGEIKLRLLYRHRLGNKNIRLQADIYGSTSSANVAIGIGKDSLNAPVGVVYASTFSTTPSTQTVELPVSSFTPGNTYMIDITLRDVNTIGTVYMTNVIVDVENY